MARCLLLSIFSSKEVGWLALQAIPGWSKGFRAWRAPLRFLDGGKCADEPRGRQAERRPDSLHDHRRVRPRKHIDADGISEFRYLEAPPDPPMTCFGTAVR